MEDKNKSILTISGGDELMTRQEVADLLKISLVTLHNLKNRGILKPTYRVGRKPLYLLSEVLKQTLIYKAS